ncbi:MAG: kynureninase [Actinobacteria bacterium]|nr:kynureninase [Actinomycetota bacterium]
MIALEEIRRSPNALAPHYRRFGVEERLLLTGHSHQAWPDVAAEGQLAAFADAAALVDDKWGPAPAKAEEVRAGFRRLLGDPEGDVALGANTHDLLVRFLSALDLRGRPRLLTTDGEFHTVRRQLARLAEYGLEVVRVPTEPVATLAERLAAATDERTGAVIVSAVLFETARIVPDLGPLAAACAQRGAQLLVDVYHALGPVPFDLHGQDLGDAWIVGGGYKYLQLGEGNCFLRLPPQAQTMRPVVTGWFAEFDSLAGDGDPETVTYGSGGARFAGSTYDTTSHYRAARVFEFFAEQGLAPAFLREVAQHQVGRLAANFDALDLDERLITRDRTVPISGLAGFLALRTPHVAELQSALAARGVLTDGRRDHLRLGPAPYLSDAQLDAAVAALGEAVGALAPAR